MDNLFEVNDKRIVITGGAGVLCGTLAKHLAARGAKVCIADYDEFRANQLAKEIETDGGFALPIRMNVLDKDQVQCGFNCVLDTLGGIDILINGAGGNKKEATATNELSFFALHLRCHSIVAKSTFQEYLHFQTLRTARIVLIF